MVSWGFSLPDRKKKVPARNMEGTSRMMGTGEDGHQKSKVPGEEIGGQKMVIGEHMGTAGKGVGCAGLLCTQGPGLWVVGP